MSFRRFAYAMAVILLAIFFSLPSVAGALIAGGNAYSQRSLGSLFSSWPIRGNYWNAGSYFVQFSTFWQGKFLYTTDVFTPLRHWRTYEVDPETGELSEPRIKLPADDEMLYPLPVGDRLFLNGRSGCYEVVDGVARPVHFVNYERSPIGTGIFSYFQWNGEPAVIEGTLSGFIVSVVKEGTWQPIGEVVIPDPVRPEPYLSDHQAFVRFASINVVNQGDQIHLYLNLENRLFHREGLKLIPVADAPGDSVTSPQIKNGPVPANSPTANESTEKQAKSAGWTLIRPDSGVDWKTFSVHATHMEPAFIEGRPALLEILTGKIRPQGRLFRFDGNRWVDEATYEFPLGSQLFRTFPTADGQRTYLVAGTLVGAANVYAIDATGIQQTHGTSQIRVEFAQRLLLECMLPAFLLISGICLGTGVWFLMWLCTSSEYQFGHQSLKLASLGRRGIARLIDLGLITSSTIGIGWLLLKDFDLVAVADASNLDVQHPLLPAFLRIVLLLMIWLGTINFAFVVSQSLWGLTPGKWLCRLRTVRSSLRGCGFASSLAREVVFFVDCGNLLFWTPGIVCIALSRCRQRLGDLVADTIVVDARSIVAHADRTR